VRASANKEPYVAKPVHSYYWPVFTPFITHSTVDFTWINANRSLYRYY